ncbi:hypothetical protein [Clostridium perfringens]|uniref:hypothetical protein n=1 Tax=Clostridium perfringens TaxID=1502 RepID=UPI003B02E0AF
MKKSCVSCINKYSSSYSEWCIFSNSKVKENICDKYDDKLDLNDLVADTEMYECEEEMYKEIDMEALEKIIIDM